MRHDILFLYNGAATPAMLEMASFARDSGLRPVLILLDRGEQQLIMDSSLLGYDVIRIDVEYKRVDLMRWMSFPSLLFKVRKQIDRELASGGRIITSSFDMLVIAWFASIFRGFEIRHQVRDLHSLQLGESLSSRVLRFIERVVLRRVQKLIVSSPRYVTDYYSKIYSGESVLLENVPQQSVWEGFERKPRADGTFVIGYIGVLRYLDSLFALIDAVEKLADEGVKVKVVFAGGGIASDVHALKARARNKALFEFHGPYEYSKDIKKLYEDVDLIYAVYDERIRNCRIAMPNKFYESVLAGIPLLVASNTFVGEQTLKEGIGEVVALSEPVCLYDLLVSATRRTGWYSAALERLRQKSADGLFAQYRLAIQDSVL